MMEKASDGWRAGRCGFSLLELLVVVAVIAVLVAIAVPAFSYARAVSRAAVCQSNLKQVGNAVGIYHNENNGRFFRYYRDEPGGRGWWFGFEEGGPGSGTGRVIDRARSPLYANLPTRGGELMCPSFSYDDPLLYPKFSEPTASYGYNLHLGPANTGLGVAMIDRLPTPAETMTFADAIHFDQNPGYNEGHYILWNANPAFASGYGHFRHDGRAHTLFADGHTGPIEMPGDMPVHRDEGGGAAANLSRADRRDVFYGLNRR